MSIFNEKQRKAMTDGEYICSECGGLMEFEDEWEDTLVCPHCGHSIDLEEYGCEGDEKNTRIYIRLERKFWVLPRMSPKKKIKNAIS